MTGPGLPDEQPVFAHHARALLARQAQADRDLVGASYRRGRNHQPELEPGHSPARRKADALAAAVGIDFHRPSPIRRGGRQTGGGRVAHFDMKPMGKTYVPTNSDGKAHHRFTAKAKEGAHFDYLRDGAKVTIISHLDYIRRDQAVADLAEDLVIDMIDEQVIRGGMNARAIVSNVPGSPERQRSLFVAAEQSESQPRVHQLTASTAEVGRYDRVAGFATSPDWLRDMSRRLKAARREAEAEASAKGRPFKDRQVVVADVTPEQAFDRLTWFDKHPSFPAPRWQQGRTGRSHHRFVQELPADAKPEQHGQILRDIVAMLAADGWMAVGVIHQPDQHGDKRNFHIHIDAYDRPAKWLDEEGKWDFEVVERKNGKNTRPYRQNKVSYRAEPDANGKRAKVDTAELMRGRFIDIVNAVMGQERYLHGTYEENGIALTPLEHMGNRATGHERRGVATEVGTRNARRIVSDELAACDRKAAAATDVLARDMTLILPSIGDQPDAVAVARRYERLSRRLIQRRHDMDVTDVVVAASRSRAEAVIATLEPEPGRRTKPRAGDRALLEAAHAHLEWVAQHSPSDEERLAERQRLARIGAQAGAAWDEVAAAIATKGQRTPAITYVSTRTAPAATIHHPDYQEQVRGRLRQWLTRHGRDEGRLIFEGDAVRLASDVPKSIDRLMQLLAGEEEFQNWLVSERERRADQAAADAKRQRDKQAALQRAEAGRREQEAAKAEAGEVVRTIFPPEDRARPQSVAADMPAAQPPGRPPVPERKWPPETVPPASQPVDRRPPDPPVVTRVDPHREKERERQVPPRPAPRDRPKGPPPHIRSKGPDDIAPPQRPMGRGSER
ncbi:hypothetical protein NS355_08890 [Sphingomonas yabuuchiae]|uniref:MobA/MobL protein domain-containing protein n=1 Tax=Sphingomonas yabuuchiae TaxID=172044 RepID=A0A147ITG8_9SPHN|nr:MobA/MobL family protein [Sphingomonas yabuuchiae]KTT98580.1 hypothetical protein NS355_08890 [Sphingomonas yabuuchiae]